MELIYDKEKMRQLVQSDMFLTMMYEAMTASGNDEQIALKILFEVNIKDHDIDNYGEEYRRIA